MFKPLERVGQTLTAPTSHPNTNHLLNNFCKINTSDNIEGPSNIPQVDKFQIENNDRMGAVELRGTVTNEPPYIYIYIYIYVIPVGISQQQQHHT